MMRKARNTSIAHKNEGKIAQFSILCRCKKLFLAPSPNTTYALKKREARKRPIIRESGKSSEFKNECAYTQKFRNFMVELDRKIV
jgi:hypothetical protein